MWLVFIIFGRTISSRSGSHKLRNTQCILPRQIGIVFGHELLRIEANDAHSLEKPGKMILTLLYMYMHKVITCWIRQPQHYEVKTWNATWNDRNSPACIEPLKLASQAKIHFTPTAQRLKHAVVDEIWKKKFRNFETCKQIDVLLVHNGTTFSAREALDAWFHLVVGIGVEDRSRCQMGRATSNFIFDEPMNSLVAVYVPVRFRWAHIAKHRCHPAGSLRHRPLFSGSPLDLSLSLSLSLSLWRTRPCLYDPLHVHTGTGEIHSRE